MRFSEADRILHLYTLERGRVGAIAKGVRKTKSRFGARLEPLSHVELMLHEGSGELQTVTGADLIGSHHATREHTYRLEIGLIGAEAMLRLFVEPEANPRAFTALTRFLDALDDTPAIELGPARARPARARVPAQASLGLGLPAAPDGLRRVRRGGARRLLPASRRRGLPHACAGIARAFGRRARRDRAAPVDAARRGAPRSADRPRPPRGPQRRHLLLRGARRLPASHLVGPRRRLTAPSSGRRAWLARPSASPTASV